LACFYSLSDVGQLFHGNGRSALFQRLGYNRLARFVIDMAHVPSFFTRDLLQQLSCRLTAVGLKTTPKRQMLITNVPKRASSKNLPAGGRSEVVFSQINPENPVTVSGRGIGQIEDEVEIPLLSLANQLRFLGFAHGEVGRLKVTRCHVDHVTALQAVEGNGVTLDRVGARIEVD